MPAIIIESINHRPPGQNLIEMSDGTTYDFRDDGTGRQVALVSVEAHQARLLSIAEGFRFAGAAGARLPAAPAVTLPALEAAFDAIVPASVTEAGPVPPKPAECAAALLDHIIYTNLEARLGPQIADAIIDELVLISKGEVMHGALPPAEASAPGVGPVTVIDDKGPTAPPVTLQKPAADPSEGGDLAVSEHADLNGKGLAEIRAIFKDEMNKNPSPRHKIEMLVAQIEAVRAERAKGPAN